VAGRARRRGHPIKVNPPSVEVVETQHLLLEPVRPDHAQGIFEAIVASRSALLPWMPWAREPSLEGAREETANSARDWEANKRFHFAAIDRVSGTALGVMGFARESDEAAELSYWIRTDHASRGLTTEACLALIDWARDSLGLRRLTLWAGRENKASRRVAEKLNFSHLGPLDWQPEGGNGTFPAERYELRLG
jgi:ribosomal-protein-serine acetyltransferase